ncbi:hypothetical protein K458DRAFT_212069 [Lentithecium fluviatile CBS 122367]|uniref:Uncharacterized protein n=1 Tax=Lentithecium fluviatile CBS 122367 TaxID=1168545 RepID=A0A6G1J7D9_9PLEO|nr:hypothetical protein K458DRAFT_212069 [Lentithecium fluviatile CBS 122367]
MHPTTMQSYTMHPAMLQSTMQPTMMQSSTVQPIVPKYFLHHTLPYPHSRESPDISCSSLYPTPLAANIACDQKAHVLMTDNHPGAHSFLHYNGLHYHKISRANEYVIVRVIPVPLGNMYGAGGTAFAVLDFRQKCTDNDPRENHRRIVKFYVDLDMARKARDFEYASYEARREASAEYHEPNIHTCSHGCIGCKPADYDIVEIGGCIVRPGISDRSDEQQSGEVRKPDEDRAGVATTEGDGGASHVSPVAPFSRRTSQPQLPASGSATTPSQTIDIPGTLHVPIAVYSSAAIAQDFNTVAYYADLASASQRCSLRAIELGDNHVSMGGFPYHSYRYENGQEKWIVSSQWRIDEVTVRQVPRGNGHRIRNLQNGCIYVVLERHGIERDDGENDMYLDLGWFPDVEEADAVAEQETEAFRETVREGYWYHLPEFTGPCYQGMHGEECERRDMKDDWRRNIDIKVLNLVGNGES